MEEKIIGFIDTVLNMFLTSIESVTVILGKDLQYNPDGTVTQMWKMVNDVQVIVRPICYTIISIFFLIEFLKMSMRIDMLKWEFLFKILSKFVIAKACIDFGPQLMVAIYSTAAEWITTFGTSAYDPSFLEAVAKGISQAIDGLGFWATIGFAITSIVPALVILACSFIVKVIAYGRLIEIYILMAMMPVPFAFLLESEGNGNITKKYILNFAGVCLQGFLIVISCSLFQYIMKGEIKNLTNGTSDALDLLFTMLLGSVVMVMAVAKSGQWGKQLLNAM